MLRNTQLAGGVSMVPSTNAAPVIEQCRKAMKAHKKYSETVLIIFCLIEVNIEVTRDHQRSKIDGLDICPEMSDGPTGKNTRFHQHIWHKSAIAPKFSGDFRCKWTIAQKNRRTFGADVS